MSSFKSFKDYLLQISNDNDNDNDYDPFNDDWNQFVDIENQTIVFRELPADQIFRKSKKVDILEPIQEIKETKCAKVCVNKLTSIIPSIQPSIKQSIKSVKDNNIKIYNTHIHLYLQHTKSKYDHTHNFDTKPNNKFYIVVIMCAYVSFNFLFT